MSRLLFLCLQHFCLSFLYNLATTTSPLEHWQRFDELCIWTILIFHDDTNPMVFFRHIADAISWEERKLLPEYAMSNKTHTHHFCISLIMKHNWGSGERKQITRVDSTMLPLSWIGPERPLLLIRIVSSKPEWTLSLLMSRRKGLRMQMTQSVSVTNLPMGSFCSVTGSTVAATTVSIRHALEWLLKRFKRHLLLAGRMVVLTWMIR